MKTLEEFKATIDAKLAGFSAVQEYISKDGEVAQRVYRKLRDLVGEAIDIDDFRARIEDRVRWAIDHRLQQAAKGSLSYTNMQDDLAEIELLISYIDHNLGRR